MSSVIFAVRHNDKATSFRFVKFCKPSVATFDVNTQMFLKKDTRRSDSSGSSSWVGKEANLEKYPRASKITCSLVDLNILRCTVQKMQMKIRRK